ncbi:kinase-like protein, partial [Daedaleopsis nitida]
MYHSKDIPDLAGHTLDHGRLLLTRVLGSGSSGVTYLAEDTTPGASPAEYAVKCIIRAQENTRRYTLQQQEIKFHKLLSPHPNVVTLHGVFYHQYYIFLVMDYCRSGDLFSYLSSRRQYRGDNDVVKELFTQVLDAVEACHQIGIFHRDIKPENFLVDETETGTKLFLTDFGLATMNPRSETFGAGSSLYMSPECVGDYAIRQPYNTRANDIWALGVILLSMISGHNPWNHASLADPCYVAYRRNASFLREMLPISRCAHHVLARIFRRERAYRIGLSELREEIAQVGSFFMHPMEIAAGSPYL